MAYLSKKLTPKKLLPNYDKFIRWFKSNVNMLMNFPLKILMQAQRKSPRNPKRIKRLKKKRRKLNLRADLMLNPNGSDAESKRPDKKEAKVKKESDSDSDL